MKDLESKLVLVTGAASGIGRATSMRFCEEGSELILVDIDEAGLKKTAQEIESRGGKAVCYQTDLRDASQVEELHLRVTDEVGTPDVIINVAGVTLVARAEEISLEDWDWVIGLNLWGCIHTIHYFIPDMMQKGQGHLVNVASVAGLFAVPYQAPYSTSKYALVGLSESLRWEAERYGIGVSVVCPGMIRTQMIENTRLIGFGESVRRSARRVAASPEKLADAILRGVRKNRAIIMYPFYIRLLYGLKRISPRSADFVGKADARLYLHQHNLGYGGRQETGRVSSLNGFVS